MTRRTEAEQETIIRWDEEAQALDVYTASPLVARRLIALGYPLKAIARGWREMAPTVAHASEVAAMDPAEQAEWLEKARDEGWTVRDLRVNIREASRRKVLTGQADTIHRFLTNVALVLRRDDGVLRLWIVLAAYKPKVCA